MKKGILLTKHRKDLQLKLFYALGSYGLTFMICFHYRINLFYFISSYFILQGKTFIFTKLSSGFWSYLYLTFWASILFITPLVFYLFFFFFLKSLFNFQVKIALCMVCFISVLLFNTLKWCILKLLPLILNFFTEFENHSGPLLITLEARIDQYLDFFSNFLFCILTITFLPLMLLGVLACTKKDYNRNMLRKYLYTGTLFIFLVVSPPDFVFQIIFFSIFTFSVELFLLIFHVGVFYIKIVNKRF